MKEFIKDVLSENGTPSSKRVACTLMVIVACSCIVATIVNDGCTECTKDLLQTIIISGISLLGLSSVTDIFKKGGNNDVRTDE